METKELIIGKWYSTEEWLKEPSMCKLLKAEIKESGYIRLYYEECIEFSNYLVYSRVRDWSSSNSYIEVTQELLDKLLPLSHPDRTHKNIKQIITEILG